MFTFVGREISNRVFFFCLFFYTLKALTILSIYATYKIMYITALLLIKILFDPWGALNLVT